MLRSTKAAALLVAVLTASVSTYAGSQGAGSQGAPVCPAPGAPVAEPYRWYPALDLARIPFHTGAGPWGPRAPIAAPAPPVTTRSVHVTSASQMAAEIRVPGTLVTVAAQYIGPVAVVGDVTDVDIVVPPGHRVAEIIIGRYTPPSTTQRVRIRGVTPGVHSGGLIGAITFASTAAIADIIIDGIDLNGDDGKGGNLLWHFVRRAERVAVVNVRGHAVGSANLDQQGGGDVVIAGNRLMSGARSREASPTGGGWAIRSGGRIVVYDNRFDGTRYHRVRLHPESGPRQYAWIANNTFVDPYEARIFSVFNVGNPSYRYSAVWAMCNRIYAHSTCILPSFDGKDADSAVLTHNAFFGSFTHVMQRTMQAAHGPGRDYLTSNTFSAWQAPPAWEAPGDPTAAVPLPLVAAIRPPVNLGIPPCLPP